MSEKTYRVALEDLEHVLETVAHIGLEEFPDVWLLLNVHAEYVVLKNL